MNPWLVEVSPLVAFLLFLWKFVCLSSHDPLIRIGILFNLCFNSVYNTVHNKDQWVNLMLHYSICLKNTYNNISNYKIQSRSKINISTFWIKIWLQVKLTLLCNWLFPIKMFKLSIWNIHKHSHFGKPRSLICVLNPWLHGDCFG